MSQTSSEFRAAALQAHNKLRELHGATALQQSADLQKSAQAWAEALAKKKVLENSPDAKRGECGESISLRSSSAKVVDISGEEVTTQWYRDIEKYNFEDGSGKAGNFTQLVWIGSREVGFGKAHVDGKVVVVAHYRPPGNVKTRYTANVRPAMGEAAAHLGSDDLEGFHIKTRVVDTEEVKENGKIFVVERERVKYEDEKGAIKEKISERRREKSVGERNASQRSRRSSSSSSSSDDEKQAAAETKSGTTLTASEKEMTKFAKKVLTQHNKYRGKHGSKPLKINKELTVLAQAFAEELSTKTRLHNSNAIFHGNRLGENIASRWSNGMTDYSAEEVVDHWYKESEKFSFEEEPTDIKGVGNFTQLVWKNSKDLGVGKAVHRGTDGSHKVVVVCYYNPSGNVMQCFRENVQQHGK